MRPDKVAFFVVGEVKESSEFKEFSEFSVLEN